MNTTATTTHYPAAPTAERAERHTLSVLVDNEPGVLARVIGLFSGRGYNIESLTVSETEHAKHLSRITIVTTGTPMVIEQIKNQLERLVPIHRVTDLTVLGAAIERELAMVKVRGTGDNRVEALRLADAGPGRNLSLAGLTPPKALSSRQARSERSSGCLSTTATGRGQGPGRASGRSTCRLRCCG